MSDPREVIADALAEKFSHGKRDAGMFVHFIAGDGLGAIAGASPNDVTAEVMSALSAAGYVLLPPGGETRQQQWGVRTSDGFTRYTSDREAGARDALRDYFPAAGARLVRREARSWPDGSEWIGPWTPVGDGE